MLFDPAWTDVAGPKEVKHRVKTRARANSGLSDSNRPKKIKPSPLDGEIDADESDNESDSNSGHENGQLLAAII